MNSGSAQEPALMLDTRGALCPQPIIELARRINDVAVGDVVALLSDDPAAHADVPAWCDMRAQTYLGERPADDGVEYRIRRTS